MLHVNADPVHPIKQLHAINSREDNGTGGTHWMSIMNQWAQWQEHVGAWAWPQESSWVDQFTPAEHNA